MGPRGDRQQERVGYDAGRRERASARGQCLCECSRVLTTPEPRPFASAGRSPRGCGCNGHLGVMPHHQEAKGTTMFSKIGSIWDGFTKTDLLLLTLGCAAIAAFYFILVT